MKVNLHANARTTPAVRSYIQNSPLSVAVLAKELGVSETTIRRWKVRNEVNDRSHVRHNLGQSTSLTEERLITSLRHDLGLSLDDIVEVMHRCVNATLSRSAIYRCLKRYNLSARQTLPKPENVTGKFEQTKFGFVHIDLKHLPKLNRKASYVFVAIERTTRFVYVEIIEDRKGETVASCLEGFLEAFGYPVHTILTDNGSEFTDRFAVKMKNKPEGKPSGRHYFDKVCKTHGIEHRLTKPFRPQTNGMVERFNRRLAQAIRNHPRASRNGGKNKFENHEQRNSFIHDFVRSYNHTRLKCLNYKSPIELLDNQTELNTFAGMT